MTSNEIAEIIIRINQYADQILQDIDPQKTKISYQLDQLKPIMEEIAKEYRVSLEDIFILYMDAASTMAVDEENELQSHIEDM